jgi:hypothetical protein
MTTPNVQDIQKLINEKRFDEARALIKSAATQKMTEKEKGAALTGVAAAYMEMTNAINKGYRDALKEAIESVRKLNASESKSKEKLQLAEVRGKLNS